MGPESTNGKIVGVIFFAWFLYSVSLSLSLSLSLSHSLSISLSLSRSLTLSLSLSLSPSLIIIYMHICAWQSADSRVTTDHCRVTLRWDFTKSFLIAWNIQKRCLTVSRRSRDLRPLSRDRSATFFKKFSNCLKRPKTLFDSRPTVAWPQPLSRDRSATFFKIFPNRLKRPKNVVWQSADGRVTSDHCRVTVQRLFSKKFLIPWNVQKTLFDSRPTVAWPQPLSRDRLATFFKIFPNCLKRPKNVVWQSADGRVTSDHCRVTVQRLFSKFSQIAWNV